MAACSCHVSACVQLCSYGVVVEVVCVRVFAEMVGVFAWLTLLLYVVVPGCAMMRCSYVVVCVEFWWLGAGSSMDVAS